MAPSRSLPISGRAISDETFRDEMLHFACNSERWQILCGGIHMLDFLVRDPDLYDSVLPCEWRIWLETVDITDIIDLLNVEDLNAIEMKNNKLTEGQRWRGYRLPPLTLIKYLQDVRNVLLDRTFGDWESRPQKSRVKPLNRQLGTGMSDKKRHEVENFSAFVSDLCQEVERTTPYRITDTVDFGAGQGYLGRVLASSLYNIDVVSVESKPHNIVGAKRTDILAQLSKKEVIYRNKKLFKAGVPRAELKRLEDEQMQQANFLASTTQKAADTKPVEDPTCARVRHIEHRITGGDLQPVIEKLKQAKSMMQINACTRNVAKKEDPEPQLMVISLHSCGNLLHHGLRAITANDSVKAIAMIGCCYNLCTERISAPTSGSANLYLRTMSKRLLETSNACDAEGFPMSEYFMRYQHNQGTGVRLNITARTMAVQAPRNWTGDACNDFFTRHWYRALLQRIFLEHGIIRIADYRDMNGKFSPHDLGVDGQPITIGRLPKDCFKSFVAYVRGALAKLASEEARGNLFRRLERNLSDHDISEFETRFKHRRHQLCVMWSFMAFSAGLAEALMIIDRWQWLREQKEISEAWVQSVFEYSQSPRNLVIVGIKR